MGRKRSSRTRPKRGRDRRPVKRIVTIPFRRQHGLAIDGSSERLVGMNPLSKTAIEGEILSEFFPEALRIRSDIVQGGVH
jgi:iron complex transport system substrate-binding protein